MSELKCPDCGFQGADTRVIGHALPFACIRCGHTWRLQDFMKVGDINSIPSCDPELTAGEVEPGPTLYEVMFTHKHITLKPGDLVRMVEDPRCNNLLLRADWTLHLLTGEFDQYVHLRRAPMYLRTAHG